MSQVETFKNSEANYYCFFSAVTFMDYLLNKRRFNIEGFTFSIIFS
jgi:hypothetical protein